MTTLKDIISVLKIIGISMAGATFVVLMIKIAIEPEYKARYLKLTKHLLIATILVTISVSLVEIPKYYYGSHVSIVDNEKSKTTIAELKDKDAQGRETINIDGKWYVVTDTGMKLGALTNDGALLNVTTMGLYDTGKVIENVSFLRLFSESQGTFKGYFANIVYYKDQDGLIFPVETTYSQYQALKAGKGNGGVMYNGGGQGSFGGGNGRWLKIKNK